MKFGLGQFTLQIPPWDSRTPDRLYADTLDLAAFAEQAGFSSFWLAEHHGSQDSYIPSLLPFLSAVAARTSRIEIGTAVMLAPFHDPLRLAEDAAVVDCISGGRLRLGLGLGWVEYEYQMFGVPMKGRGKRLEEIVHVLRRAWTGEPFSFKGNFYDIDQATVTPRPANGTVPIFLGGQADAAVERAAIMADGHFPPSVVAGSSVGDRAKLVAGMRRERELKGPYRFGCFLPVGFGSDFDEGWRSIRDGVLHVRGSYATWLQGGRDVGGARELAAQFEDSQRTGVVAGTPDQVVQQLRPIVEGIAESGLDEPFVSVILAPCGTTLDDAKRRVETFASSVIAAFPD